MGLGGIKKRVHRDEIHSIRYIRVRFGPIPWSRTWVSYGSTIVSLEVPGIEKKKDGISSSDGREWKQQVVDLPAVI